jgi:hypothetical protein
MHDGPAAFRFELAGNLAGSDAAKLDQAYRTASSTIAGKTLAVDLTFITAVDAQGLRLLERWRQAGARFIANSPMARTLVESVTGQLYQPEDAVVGPTFHAHFTATSSRVALAAVVLAATLLFPAQASAAGPKQETLDAWNQYLHQANTQMVQRAKGAFLWTEESPDRLSRVRAGEVVVSPVRQAPQPVPSGLIHHWIGAAFIPGARIEDVIAVVRDYDRYTEFYKPSVIDAKTLSRKAAEDRFSVVVFDQPMFMKHALDTEYQSRFSQVGPRKWYSIAETGRVQELASSGEPVPDREASGYIWRLSTISRYEERDGGVYIETETMALSRTIPALLHFVVDPIVRRVSHATLATSLEQTRDATGGFAKSASVTSRGSLEKAPVVSLNAFR